MNESRIQHQALWIIVVMVFFLAWLMITPELLGRLISGVGVAFFAFMLGDHVHHEEHTS